MILDNFRRNTVLSNMKYYCNYLLNAKLQFMKDYKKYIV